MSFFGFDVRGSDGSNRHFLFAHEAKECAKTLIAQGHVKSAYVVDCEGGSVIREYPDPDATEELACAEMSQAITKDAMSLVQKYLPEFKELPATSAELEAKIAMLPEAAAQEVKKALSSSSYESLKAEFQAFRQQAGDSGKSKDAPRAAEMAGNTGKPGSTVRLAELREPYVTTAKSFFEEDLPALLAAGQFGDVTGTAAFEISGPMGGAYLVDFGGRRVTAIKTSEGSGLSAIVKAHGLDFMALVEGRMSAADGVLVGRLEVAGEAVFIGRLMQGLESLAKLYPLAARD
jgi:hypothetical protein